MSIGIQHFGHGGGRIRSEARGRLMDNRRSVHQGVRVWIQNVDVLAEHWSGGVDGHQYQNNIYVRNHDSRGRGYVQWHVYAYGVFSKTVTKADKIIYNPFLYMF